MPGSGERLRRTAVELRQGELSLERDFYLEEFRGRSVLVAVAPGAADLGPLAGAVGDLVRNDTRVLLCWFDLAPAALPVRTVTRLPTQAKMLRALLALSTGFAMLTPGSTASAAQPMAGIPTRTL